MAEGLGPPQHAIFDDRIVLLPVSLALLLAQCQYADRCLHERRSNLANCYPASAACRGGTQNRSTPEHCHKLAPLPCRKTARLPIDLLAGEHSTDHGERGRRDYRSIHPVFEKSSMSHRNPACKDAEDYFGVGTDLMLGMGIGAQGKKMHQIVQVDFPVPLGVI